MPKECNKEGCNNPRFSGGFCKWHYTPKKKLKKVRQKIKQVSSKRAAQNKIYSVMRKMFLEQHPNCAVYPHLLSTEIHHSNSRRDKKLIDTEFWFAVSREGHLWIHSNVEEAEEKGFLIKGRNSKKI